MTSKRLFDLAVLLLLAPLAGIIAGIVAVALRARGRPVLYRAERRDTLGQPFIMVKFRTLDLAPGSSSGVHHGRRGETAFTGWLRRTRLDEIPQLLHVLSGRMSLVGPRPLAAGAGVTGRRSTRHAARSERRPGLTGLATVMLCDREDRLLARCHHPEAAISLYRQRCLGPKVRIDALYARNESRWLDLYVLYLTTARLVPLPGRRARRVRRLASRLQPQVARRPREFLAPRFDQG